MPGHDRNSSGPSTSTSSPSASTSTSHWHKIRPWAPHFILTIREITSVSATFILSSTLSSKDSQEAEDLVSGNISDDDLEDSAASTSVHVVSDALAKGFTVNVNGTPWKRSFIRMVDDGDEAIIILHGLIPGKRHDIEIGIDSGDGEEIVHTHMTTSKDPEDTQTITESSPSTFPPLPPTESNDGDAPSVDEYAALLRSQINQLASEHASLSASLKQTRRDSQKADAALKSEIEAIRRACEKAATGEQRAKQKALALQEAVKQARAAAEDTEGTVASTENELPALREEEKAAERLHAEAKRDLDRAEEEKDEALKADKKRIAELKAELAALDTRFEKLRTKRDKLRNETLPGIEREIERVGREVELVERDANGFVVVDRGPVTFGLDLQPAASVISATQSAPGGGKTVLAPIGSHRGAGGYVPRTLFPNPTSTVPSLNSIGAQPMSISQSTQPTSTTPPYKYNHPSNSSLSSLAPPFDPTVGYSYVHSLGNKPSNTRTTPLSSPPPGLSQPTSTTTPLASTLHQHTQSWDVANSDPGVSSSTELLRRQQLVPVRQASLPLPVGNGGTGKGRGGR